MQFYYCEKCNYHTTLQKDYNRHCKSKKHLKAIANDSSHYTIENGRFMCICGKSYEHKRTLNSHQRICELVCQLENNHTLVVPEKSTPSPPSTSDKSENSDIAAGMMAIAEAMRFQTEQNERQSKRDEQRAKREEKQAALLLEAVKQPRTVNNNINQVSINVFLNDKCKDAMNLLDFVDNLEYRLEDLERFGRAGYVEGVSQLMIEGMKDMDITKRPIHCTDLKRDALYIKDNDEWTKENPNSSTMKRAIRKIAGKNISNLPDWKKKNPDYDDIHSRKHEQYITMCNHVVGGINDEEDNKNFKKIVKKVANEVVLDKENDLTISEIPKETKDLVKVKTK